MFHEIPNSFFDKSVQDWNVIDYEKSCVNDTVTLFLMEKNGDIFIGFGEDCSENFPVSDEVMELEVFTDRVGDSDEYVSLLSERSCKYCGEGVRPIAGHPNFVSILACSECHDPVRKQFEEMIEKNSNLIMGVTV